MMPRGTLFTAPVALMLLALAACGGRDRWSESWENQFEDAQPSIAIMDTLGIAWGMQVAEIGAGSGRMAVKVARRVGPSGHVWANDIDPTALDFMKNRVKRRRIGNMTVVAGKVTDPRLPPHSMDLIFLINTYEHLSRPVPLLRQAAQALKDDGRLVVVAADAGKTAGRRRMATPRAQVIFEAEEAGYSLVRESGFLRDDNIYFFKPVQKTTNLP